MYNDPVNYFKQHTEFVPLANGNASLYGLNSWGTDSTIMFKGEKDVWRFYAFVNGPSRMAQYVTCDEQSRTIPCEYNEDIIAMQPVNLIK